MYVTYVYVLKLIGHVIHLLPVLY